MRPAERDGEKKREKRHAKNKKYEIKRLTASLELRSSSMLTATVASESCLEVMMVMGGVVAVVVGRPGGEGGVKGKR